MRPLVLAGLALALFASLSACKKLEEKAEDRATDAVERKIGMSAMGGSFTSGVCQGWPATVPVYPGATQVHCISLDIDKAKHSALGRLIAAGASSSEAAQPDLPDLGQAGMMVSYHVDVDRSKLASFYASTLPYEANAQGTAFANRSHPTDPVLSVQILPATGDPGAVVVAVELQAEK